MGNYQTTAGVPVQGGVPVADETVGDSGVRITGQAIQTLDDRVKEAYEQGRKEGVESFSSALEVVAAQVYDNIHSQLADIQKESLSKSESVVSQK